jgi:hypothetical protein
MLRVMAQRLSRSEFHPWAADQPKGRFERVAGTPAAMAPERQRLKVRIRKALDPRIASDGSIEPDPPGIKQRPDEAYGDRP